MCRGCWTEQYHGATALPRNYAGIVADIKTLYSQEHCSTGGPLHVELEYGGHTVSKWSHRSEACECDEFPAGQHRHYEKPTNEPGVVRTYTTPTKPTSDQWNAYIKSTAERMGLVSKGITNVTDRSPEQTFTYTRLTTYRVDAHCEHGKVLTVTGPHIDPPGSAIWDGRYGHCAPDGCTAVLDEQYPKIEMRDAT